MNKITRTGWDVLDEARALLRAAVAGVPADGWPGRRRSGHEAAGTRSRRSRHAGIATRAVRGCAGCR